MQRGRSDHPAGFGGYQRLSEHRNAEIAHLQQRAAEIVFHQILNVPIDQKGRQQPEFPLPSQRPVYLRAAAASGAKALLTKQHPNGNKDQQVERREHEGVEGEDQRDAGVRELQFPEDERGNLDPRQQTVQITHALKGKKQQKIDQSSAAWEKNSTLSRLTASVMTPASGSIHAIACVAQEQQRNAGLKRREQQHRQHDERERDQTGNGQESPEQIVVIGDRLSAAVQIERDTAVDERVEEQQRDGFSSSVQREYTFAETISTQKHLASRRSAASAGW